MDDDFFGHYETTELKMTNSSKQAGTSKQTNNSNQNKIPSRNGFYDHNQEGSKSFGAGTAIFILVVLAIGMAISLAFKDANPLLSGIIAIASLVIVFAGILGGNRPKEYQDEIETEVSDKDNKDI